MTAGVLTLQWDPSPDSAVAGYTVYVGTQPGKYSTTFNVGNQLRFVYEDAQPGQWYYFSVAAYASGNILGPLSEEVSASTDGTQPLPAPGEGNSLPNAPTTPALIVTMPTSSSSFTTSKSSVLLGGVAVDDQAVAAVQWKNDRGGAGLATGTDQWVAAVPLKLGMNEITLTVIDGSSNSSSIRVSVYRTTSSRESPPLGARVE